MILVSGLIAILSKERYFQGLFFLHSNANQWHRTHIIAAEISEVYSCTFLELDKKVLFVSIFDFIKDMPRKEKVLNARF